LPFIVEYIVAAKEPATTNNFNGPLSAKNPFARNFSTFPKPIRILVKKTKTHYQMSNLAFITILNNLKGNFKQR